MLQVWRAHLAVQDTAGVTATTSLCVSFPFLSHTPWSSVTLRHTLLIRVSVSVSLDPSPVDPDLRPLLSVSSRDLLIWYIADVSSRGDPPSVLATTDLTPVSSLREPLLSLVSRHRFARDPRP